jgi:hypothetical protein
VGHEVGREAGLQEASDAASWWPSVAGPGVLLPIKAIAHGCRFMTLRTEMARARIVSFQPNPPGTSIVLKSVSIMPSRRSSLLVTWL